MAIPSAFIEQLKDSCDIERVISSYLTLKRRGRNLQGLCPFHSEKTPSFTVYPESQSFYCFGCGAGGDVITFIKKIENLEYMEALKFLAEKEGIPFPESSADDQAARIKARILEMNRAAARFYHSCLLSPEGRVGLDYLKNRGLSDKTIRHFGLGYSPAAWSKTMEYLRSLGFTQEEMLAGALIAKGRNGGFYDLFRNRVMFPIIDLRGNVIGFGGRALEEKGPKYLNSADTPAFKKSKNLFALNFAKASKENSLILTEGYMDTISVHQAGFTNAVATLGTSLTPEQSRLIAQYVPEVIIAYDSDGPGQTATKRAAGLFSETGIKVKVLSYQEAKDPDEYIKKFGPLRFKRLLEGSANATEFALAKARNAHDITTDDGKLEYLKEAVAVLAGLPSPVERDVYAAKIAEEVGVSKDAILMQARSQIKKRVHEQKKKEERELALQVGSHSASQDRERRENLRAAQAEESILAALYKNPDLLQEVLQRITSNDFVTALNRKVFDIILDRLTNNRPIELISLSDLLSEEELARLSSVLAAASDIKYGKEDLFRCIDVLKECAHAPKFGDIKEMATDSINDYIKSLRNKK